MTMKWHAVCHMLKKKAEKFIKNNKKIEAKIISLTPLLLQATCWFVAQPCIVHQLTLWLLAATIKLKSKIEKASRFIPEKVLI